MNKQTEFMDIENRLLVTRGAEGKWEVVWEVGEMGEGDQNVQTNFQLRDK